MIEAYAFYAAFAAQILLMSVLVPAWFIRQVHASANDFPAEHMAQLTPRFDPVTAMKLFYTLSLIIAALGLALLGWLISRNPGTHWDFEEAEAMAGIYLAMQIVPHGLIGWTQSRYNKMLEQLRGGKRTALLRPRRLFDFISPFAVSLALFVYVLFVAYVIYLAQDPPPKFTGYLSIVSVTLIYALNAFSVYRMLYGKKANPLETHGTRERAISMGVKVSVYTCTAFVVHRAIHHTLKLFEAISWEPFATCVFVTILGLISVIAFAATTRNPEADDGFPGVVTQQPVK